MQTNKEIVDSHLELIKKCCDYQFSKTKNKLDQQNRKDFTNDLYLILLDYDNKKLNDALTKGEGTLNALITRILQNNIYSKTSTYYRQYKRHLMKTDDITLKIKLEDTDEDNDGRGIPDLNNG